MLENQQSFDFDRNLSIICRMFTTSNPKIHSRYSLKIESNLTLFNELIQKYAKYIHVQ